MDGKPMKDHTIDNQTNLLNQQGYGPNPAHMVQAMQRIEEKTGVDMRGIRIHTDSSLPRAVQAEAYAAGGNQVYLAPGKAHHLNHELGHIVQQRKGMVKPTGQVHGVACNDDQSLERQATEIGRL